MSKIHIHIHRPLVRDAGEAEKLRTELKELEAETPKSRERAEAIKTRMNIISKRLKEIRLAQSKDADYSEANPQAIAHIKSLADRVKSTASQGFSKKGAAKAAKCLTDAIDAMLYERD